MPIILVNLRTPQMRYPNCVKYPANMGVTLKEFLRDRGIDASLCRVTVNRRLRLGDYVLNSGDLVRVSKRKIDNSLYFHPYPGDTGRCAYCQHRETPGTKRSCVESVGFRENDAPYPVRIMRCVVCGNNWEEILAPVLRRPLSTT